jgi:hypothetical protein
LYLIVVLGFLAAFISKTWANSKWSSNTENLQRP